MKTEKNDNKNALHPTLHHSMKPYGGRIDCNGHVFDIIWPKWQLNCLKCNYSSFFICSCILRVRERKHRDSHCLTLYLINETCNCVLRYVCVLHSLILCELSNAIDKYLILFIQIIDERRFLDSLVCIWTQCSFVRDICSFDYAIIVFTFAFIWKRKSLHRKEKVKWNGITAVNIEANNCCFFFMSIRLSLRIHLKHFFLAIASLVKCDQWRNIW